MNICAQVFEYVFSGLLEITYHMNCWVIGVTMFVCMYVCMYFWLRWVFIAARRLSLVAASGGYCSLQCIGFSLRWLLLLQSMGF